ncbi:S9 family peptidase [Kribbia dieselivorans]|uniref:S9 family peptidase n=1 Tax=Kribbia dieselivorans TaxID=331526 RepID=UPI0008391DF0|nr:S9 family peptidase [Kribbia dieselivorans]
MTDTRTAPRAPQRPIARTHHGDTVIDDYAWLADPENPEVLAHLRAENDYADAVTADLADLRQAIFDEIKSRVQETDLSVPVADGPWWYYSRTIEGGQYAISCRAPLTDRATPPAVDAPVTGEQVLLDGNAAAAGHEFFAVGALTVSADHAVMAHAIDTTGDERFDVTVVDLATGAVLDTAVTNTGYGVELSRDGRYLFYVRVDEAWRPHELWRHEVGSDPAHDVLILAEPDERFWMGVGTSRGDTHLMVALGSRTTSEVHLLDLRDPLGPLRCVAPRREGVEYDVEPAGDHLLITHNTDHKDFDVAWAPLTATSADQWRPLLSSGAGERFLGMDAFADFAVLTLRSDGLPGLRLLPRATSVEPVDGVSPWDTARIESVTYGAPGGAISAADTPEFHTDRVRITHESWTRPRSVVDHVVATGEQVLLKQQPVLGGYDPAAYAESREWATAADGVRVPVSVVRRADVAPDGTHPALLTGYGSYEISSDPYFSVARLSLLDRGVVYAVAHVRGGGELGRDWYEQGRLAHKTNTFTDFLACADHLVETGWAAPDRLAAEGGSAGGLLMGAVVNLAPQRFSVVHAQVPFVDALTTILDPSQPLTVGEWEEWGNPLADPEVYAYMKSYSPYENVAAVAHPAILATTSLNDTRVSYAEPAKWVAKLREVSTSDPAEAPVLLRTEMVAGHGGRSGRYDAWHETAWEWAFILNRLGVRQP